LFCLILLSALRYSPATNPQDSVFSAQNRLQFWAFLVNDRCNFCPRFRPRTGIAVRGPRGVPQQCPETTRLHAFGLKALALSNFATGLCNRKKIAPNNHPKLITGPNIPAWIKSASEPPLWANGRYVVLQRVNSSTSVHPNAQSSGQYSPSKAVPAFSQ